MTRATHSGALVIGVVLATLTLMAVGGWWLLRDPTPEEAPAPRVEEPAVPEPGPAAPLLDRRPEPAVPHAADPLTSLTPEKAREHARAGQVELFGRVLQEGAEVAGATVWLDGTQQAVSDEQGRYRFVAPFQAAIWVGERPRGPTLAAWHADHGCAVKECPPRGGRVDLDLGQGPDGRLSVEVIDRESGRDLGIAAVEVHVYPQLRELPVQKGFTLNLQTDGQGRLSVEGLPPGKVALRATASKYGMLRYEQRHARDGQFGHVNLALTMAQTVLGRFAPWPPPFATEGVPLTLGVALPDLRLLEQRLSADGRFSLDILRPAAELTLHLSQGDAIVWHHEIEHLPFESRTDLGVIRILPAARVHGRVELAPLWLEHGLEVHLQYLSGSQARRALTLEEDGTFDSGPVPTGVFTVGLLFHQQVLALERARVDPGQVHEVSPMTLPLGVWAGRVQDTDGRGVAIAMNLWAEAQEGRKRRNLGQWRSDAEGWFVGRVRDPQGQTATLEIRDVDGRLLVATPLALDQAQQTPLFLEIPPLSLMDGVLVDADGRALGDWSVTFDTASGRRFHEMTAADGSFAVLGAGAGPWSAILVSPEGNAFELPVAAGGRRLVLRLDQATARTP